MGSSPNWLDGYTPTSREWNALWASKADDGGLGAYLPLIGGTLTGGLTGTTATFSGALSGSGITSVGSPSLLVGSGLANRFNLAPSVAGVIPSMTVTGTDGLSIITALVKIVAPTQITPAWVLSGASTNPNFQVATNITGTTTGNPSLVNISTSSDTANSSGDVLPLLNVTHIFGGTGFVGNRQGVMIGLTQRDPIAAGKGGSFNALQVGFDGFSNAGGTALTATDTNGNGVAFYPQTVLHPGADKYNSAVVFEADLDVFPTRQTLTVSGTIGVGSVITATFTSPSDIPGSPVSVTYTTGAGNTAQHIVNGLAAAINANANLQAAYAAGTLDVTDPTKLAFNWQTQQNVTVTVSTTGPEILTLGPVVTGATTWIRRGGSIVRGINDGQRAAGDDDFGFAVSAASQASPSGGYIRGYQIGGIGPWPVAWDGTLFGAREQSVLLNTGFSGPFAGARSKYGIDLSPVNFTLSSGLSLRMPGGWQVDGTGAQSIKNATLSVDTNGLTLDVVGVVGTGNPTIVSGGGSGSESTTHNYYAGIDIVKGPNGGQYQVTSVDPSTGAVTALTTLVQPSSISGSLGVAVATTGGSGKGLTITPTGVANTSLRLMPSGGIVNMLGALKFSGTNIVSNGAIATTMTSLGPTGSHTTIQEWLTVQNSAGTTRYIPLY